MSDSDELTPGPAAGNPTELQQLEAALAAGVITPELFATLKAKLQPAAPATAPPAPKRTPPPAEVELPSLLDMFSRSPGPVEAPSAPPAPVPRTPPPAPVASPPPRPTAADDAARQRIEEHLAKMRQAPPPAPPSFYPEPTPTFYPESKPAPPVVPAAPVAPARPPASPVRPPRPSQPASEGRTSASWVVILLIIGVIGTIAYFLTNSSHPDEDLTSTAPATTAPPPAAAPTPVSKKPKMHSRLLKHKAKAAQVAVPVASAGPDSVEETEVAATSSAPAPPSAPASSPSAAGRPIPAAGEPGDDAATTKVRAAMASYYADLYAPPLHASEHFAPQVERLYIRQNLTPAAIDAELGRSFFPDNQQATARIEPGTLRLSDSAADGSRTATFTEQMRLYRPSLQKYQRLRTQVRVRFNADYQIVYMRQEKLLSNTFEE